MAIFKNSNFLGCRKGNDFLVKLIHIPSPASAGIDLGSRNNYVAINPDIAAEMGVEIVCQFAATTDGHRVLPLKYHGRVLNVLGLKAIVVRPGFPSWNPSPVPAPWSGCSSRLASPSIAGIGKSRFLLKIVAKFAFFK